jgi:hypothetical protein
MKSFKPLVLPALALLLGCSGAGAQTVYRCGNSYSQTPCANAVAIQTDDPRTEEQRAAAQEGLVRDKALAKEMETARRRDEAQALALDKAALARAAAAHKKQEQQEKRDQHAKQSASGKKAGSAKIRTVKVQDADVFTATDGAVSQKKKASKSGKP